MGHFPYEIYVCDFIFIFCSCDIRISFCCNLVRPGAFDIPAKGISCNLDCRPVISSFALNHVSLPRLTEIGPPFT
jgi:hypothetical protein